MSAVRPESVSGPGAARPSSWLARVSGPAGTPARSSSRSATQSNSAGEPSGSGTPVRRFSHRETAPPSRSAATADPGTSPKFSRSAVRSRPATVTISTTAVIASPANPNTISRIIAAPTVTHGVTAPARDPATKAETSPSQPSSRPNPMTASSARATPDTSDSPPSSTRSTARYPNPAPPSPATSIR